MIQSIQEVCTTQRIVVEAAVEAMRKHMAMKPITNEKEQGFPLDQWYDKRDRLRTFLATERARYNNLLDLL